MSQNHEEIVPEEEGHEHVDDEHDGSNEEMTDVIRDDLYGGGSQHPDPIAEKRLSEEEIN